MSKQSKRIALLLDGDYLLFSAMSASEEEVDWGGRHLVPPMRPQ